MKHSTTILFGVSLAVVAGLFGSGIFGVTVTKADQTNLGTTGLFTGHVTTTLVDSEGNVKEYRQSDNLIVNQGENCALKLLFQTTTGAAGSTVCVGANTQGFKFIEIGNVSASQSGTPASPLSTDFRLYGSHNNTGSAGNNPGLVRKAATTVTWTNSTSATSTGAASVVLAATFTNSGSSSKTVNESGLFNETASATGNTDAMFARQVFSTITMAASDSLTVQWTINVGGTTTIS